ncbi:MAG: hypothetical protein J7J88_00550 [Dehalococcoidia bacterium]|nr:hypothetical protein [Dehalococcoidia bacterium]
MWQKVALILIGLGVLVLAIWGIKDFFTQADIPLLVRIAAGAIGGGVLVLIGIAIKDRMDKSKKDDFKGVER